MSHGRQVSSVESAKACRCLKEWMETVYHYEMLSGRHIPPDPSSCQWLYNTAPELHWYQTLKFQKTLIRVTTRTLYFVFWGHQGIIHIKKKNQNLYWNNIQYRLFNPNSLYCSTHDDLYLSVQTQAHKWTFSVNFTNLYMLALIYR